MKTTKPVTMSLIIIAAAVFSACSAESPSAVATQARNDMMEARAAYTKCLQENAADPHKCASESQAFEADLQAYRATQASVKP